jgi:hypothetical protein
LCREQFSNCRRQITGMTASLVELAHAKQAFSFGQGNETGLL